MEEKKATIFKDGCCQYTDGTPSYVKPFEHVDEIPQDYLDYAEKYGGDPAEAWQATMDWRRENDIWNVIKTPTPLFRECAEMDPLFYHGHNKDGHPVMWEVGSKIDCFRYTKISEEDHLRRVYYICEFGRNVLCEGGFTVPGVKPSGPRDPAKGFGVVFVMDFGGVDLAGYFGGGAFQNRCSAFDVLSVHWPMQVKHTFVINVPSMLLSVGRPILYRAMRGFKKPEVISASVSLERLRTQIDDDQIPQEYGGSSPYKLGEHPYHLKLCALSEQYLPKSLPDVTTAAVADDKSITEEAPADTARQTTRTVPDAGHVHSERSSNNGSFVKLILELWAALLAVVAGFGQFFGKFFGNSFPAKSYSSDVSSDNAGSLGSVTENGSDTSNSHVEGTVIDVPRNGAEDGVKKRRKTLPGLRRSLKRLSLKKRLSLPGKRFRKRRQKVD